MSESVFQEILVPCGVHMVIHDIALHPYDGSPSIPLYCEGDFCPLPSFFSQFAEDYNVLAEEDEGLDSRVRGNDGGEQ